MTPPTLLYDGHCNFCRRQAATLRDLTGNRIQLVSFHEPGVLVRFPRVTREACEQAMQLILPDGRIFAGAAAAAEAARFHPVLRWVSPLYYLPGIRQISDGVYRWVARNRFRFGGRCQDGQCAHS